MTDIKTRLQESADACLKAYEAWSANEKKSESRESLQEAIHELRKVASRLEIDLAISERDQMAQKPIPIPSHRDSRNRKNQPPLEIEDNIGNSGNNAGADNNNDHNRPKIQRRRPPRGKASGDDN